MFEMQRIANRWKCFNYEVSLSAAYLKKEIFNRKTC